LFKENWTDFIEDVGLCRESYSRFRTIIYHHYFAHRRSFSWRDQVTPYRVYVSEIMLQQTQTTRVAVKFDPFVATFPDFRSLAEAPFSDVLRLWKGLGYNRRAKFLQQGAGIIVDEHGGRLPEDPSLLVRIPGIGPATAASICAFAFNKPVSFIETNIRTVFLHFFFRRQEQVDDDRIMVLVSETLDYDRPREWYYALMDYGVLLKKTVGNLNRKSKHYTKQSPFEGSNRQIRGAILQLLLDTPEMLAASLPELLDQDSIRVEKILNALCDEGLVLRNGGIVRLG